MVRAVSGREARKIAASFPRPQTMSLDQLAAEVEALLAHERELRDRPVCARTYCDGSPHIGFPFPHTPPPKKLPADPIAQATELDSGFRVRPHLRYLSDRLARAVSDVEGGTTRFLTVSMPPRMGKSHLTSIYLPLWLLHKHPDWRIGLASHSPSLAVGWGRQVRREIEEHGSALGITLARDAGAASEWQTTEGGGVVSRSLPGQSITGLGFRCLDGSTVVYAEDGPVTVKEFHTAGRGGRILAYDHVTGRAVFRRVEASVRQRRGGLVEVTTQAGRVLRVTADHPVFAGGRYRPAGSLRHGQALVAARVPNLPHPGSGAPVLLLTGVPGDGDGAAPEAHRENMPAVRHGVPSRHEPPDVLHPGVRGPGAFRKDARGGEFASPAGIVSDDEGQRDSSRSDAQGWRSVSGLRSYREAAHASQGRGPGEQRHGEPGHGVPDVPRGASQVERDAVSAVRTLPDVEQDVYDLQVEGTANLFADGVLVHNCLLIDDPMKDFATAHSQVFRDSVWDWWTANAFTRLEMPALVAVTATRWHQDDMIGRLLSREYDGDPDDWEQIVFPAVATDTDVLGRQPGEPLLSPIVPDETPEQALARWSSIKSAVGTYAWSALYQQSPAPPGGAIFNVGDFRFWTSDPKLADEHGAVLLRPADLARGDWVDSWDTSYKGGDTSDFAVGQRWVRLGPLKVLVDQARGRWTFTEALQVMRRWGGTDPGSPRGGRFVYTRLVEDSANGPAIIDSLKDEVPGIRPWTARGSKESRYRAVTPDVERGEVLLPHPAEHGREWVPGLLAELRELPTSAHDDQGDALAQALLYYGGNAPGMVAVPTAVIDRPDATSAARAAADVRRPLTNTAPWAGRIYSAPPVVPSYPAAQRRTGSSSPWHRGDV